MEFHKYKKIFAYGHDENQEIFDDPTDRIQITEKNDGNNFRWTILNGNIKEQTINQE